MFFAPIKFKLTHLDLKLSSLIALLNIYEGSHKR